MVLEEVVKDERQNGKEFAQEIKDETKTEMLEYLKVKQEVRHRFPFVYINPSVLVALQYLLF